MNHRSFLLICFMGLAGVSNAQNVGIGTSQPHATGLLHVNTGNSLTNGFLVSGALNQSSSLPNLGTGSRLMFYPGKAAFRAGYAEANEWDNSNAGIASIALGYGARANGISAVALGYRTFANGNFSSALGYYTVASGISSTAAGDYATASGESSTAIGDYATASGTNSTALGFNTAASGNYSTAMGNNTTASGASSSSMGQLTTASGNFSTAMGFSTFAKARSSLTIGQFNDITDAPDPLTSVSTDRLFQIGNGTQNDMRSNAITVLRNGNTGIGVLNPGYLLDVDGRMRIRSSGTGSTSAGIWLNKNDNSGLIGFIGVDGNNDIGIFTSTSTWSFLVDDATGNAWVKGTVTANGVTLTSDERLKKDITPLQDAMPILEKLNGYQYHWKDESGDTSLQTGLLAQEVEKVLPELVKTDKKGVKSVNYTGLMPYMLEAVKEQQSTIQAQQKQIDELKSMVEKLMNK